MEENNLRNFVKGWFIGNFEPSLLQTDNFEIAIKRYSSGDYEEQHFHKVSTEYTIIVNGVVKMDGVHYVADDIIIINPNESTDFECIKDAVTVVVKVPSSKNDKYCSITGKCIG